ncbi:MAG: M12 family metallo-peptidase [Planctomycetota bacterium]|nr:M12 family metallo-peptidase [Planctomycetota bacterium]
MKTSALLVGLALTASASAQDLESAVNRSLGLTESHVQKLELFGDPATGLTVPFELNGTSTQLALSAHSVRAPGFELVEQRADGSLVSVAPGPVVTLRGTVESMPDARVAGALLEDGLYARIMIADGSEFWIQPVPTSIEGASPSHHVLYERGDVLRTSHFCGADLLANNFGQPSFEEVPQNNVAMGTSLFTAEVGCDADYEYFLDYGSSTTNVSDRIQTVINSINLQYESEVSITHSITQVIVRTSSNQPYTSSDASTLLNQFRSEWNANQGSVQRDVAHLFTGKSIDGGTIGIAWVGAICSTYGYGMVESDFNNNYSSTTDLSAHELGHNWNAQHCTCTSYTMNPYITSANTFNPNVTRGTITSFRDSRTCLDSGGGGGGGGGLSNDDCATAEVITAGATAFDTTSATNSGVAWSCAGGGAADVWYSYTASSSADVTIDTCGSGYDTALQVWVGSCGSLTRIACNDDVCGLQSQIDLTGLSAGTTVLIQVAGYSGSTGTGTLTLTEASTPPPGQPGSPTPSNGAGSVSINQDLSWSAASGAASYNVYFGTSSSLGAGQLLGNQAGTSRNVGTLAFSATYYWRIDAVNASGTTTGSTWSFTTEADTPAPPGQPGSPTPSNNATSVSIDQDLAWSSASGAASYAVYFGETTSPAFQGTQGGTNFSLGQLDYETTYYWRVDASNGGGTTAGQLWSFTTETDPNTGGGETVIFADSFDGTASTAWVSNDRVRTRSSWAYAGTGGTRIRRGRYLEVTVNASGYTGLRLECARETKRLDNGEFLTISVNGNTVEQITGTSGWITSDIDLDNYAGQGSVTIRFAVNANRNNEKAFLDEFAVIGIN